LKRHCLGYGNPKCSSYFQFRNYAYTPFAEGEYNKISKEIDEYNAIAESHSPFKNGVGLFINISGYNRNGRPIPKLGARGWLAIPLERHIRDSWSYYIR